MLRVGQAEIDAMAEVIRGGEIFRYREQGHCGRFETRFGELLGTKHAALCASGTMAITAALAGLEIGPGDEVLVPAHTYMGSAIGVLAVGAIPVIVDIDASITIDPEAVDAAVGPQTRAVMPVHMWGALCDMDRLLEVARRRNLKVVEDACQCVGGFYKGRAAGAMGDAGTFSFNYFKNMTCGEGGAVVTDDDLVHKRARCAIDPCSFYWEGRDDNFTPFIHCGARVSEIQGAMLNAQLDRLPGLLDRLRAIKKRILEETADSGLVFTPRHSPDGECALNVMAQLPTPEAAQRFAETVGAVVLIDTGRHTYTQWDPILNHRGSHHPDMNPFDFPRNAPCRKDYRADMCPASLDIVRRTVSISLNPDMDEKAVDGVIETMRRGAVEVG